MTTWEEGRDGSEVIYQERLWPHWWVWILPATLVGVLAIAFGAAYGALLGWTIFVLGTGLCWAMMVRASPLVRVDDMVFRAGRARLPLLYVGNPATLNSDGVQQERRHGDARTYLLLRPWASAQAVVVTVTDPDDPHPTWVVTSRHPDQVVQALTRAIDTPAAAIDSDPAE